MRTLCVVAGSATLVALVACDSSKCSLDDELTKRAGSDATDCGLVPRGASTSSVDACVVKAFDSGAPFVARYELQGTDSQVVLGIVRDPKSSITILQWDSAPCGGPGCSPVVDALTCEGPSVDVSANRGTTPIACASTTTSARVCQ